MKNSFKGLVVLAVLGLSSNAFALPFVSVGVVAGPNYNLSSYPTVAGTSVSGGMGYSAGLSAELGPIAARALYTHANSKTDVLGVETSASANSIQVPVHFTMGLAGTHVGFGGFYETSLEDNGGSNYGASAGVKVSLPFVGVSVEGLVNYGLKDLSGSKSSTAALLLGFNIL
jgi:hypothetical protein